MIVVLMGLRGAGKTTVGQGLAERLAWRCVDLDQLTLASMGAITVAEAWNEQGEPAFRSAEAVALSDALDVEHDMILSLGGGTPTAPGAADALRRAASAGRALVVYLRADAQTLGARITSGDANRPTLTGADPVEEMQDVLASRDDLYRELADIEINAALDAPEVIGQIVEAMTQAGVRRASGGE